MNLVITAMEAVDILSFNLTFSDLRMSISSPDDEGQKDWLTLPWRLALHQRVEDQSTLHPFPFYYFCSTRNTLSKRYCKLCTRYFVTQAALKRHLTAKVCSVMRSARVADEYIVRLVPEAERDRPDDDGAVHVVVPMRNVFDVFNPDLFNFTNQFEEVV